MPTKRLFITLEGTDGVGKSTHARLLKRWLQKKGVRVLLTREPGGGALAEKIRGLLLNPAIRMAPLVELFLYEAARADHLKTVIQPALKKKRVVICDRFTDATLAYQGFARGLSLTDIAALNEVASEGLKPDLTLLLDLSPKEGLAKARARTTSGSGDRLENEGLAFQRRVRHGYLSVAKRDKKRIRVVPVQSTIEATQGLIRDIVASVLKR